MPLMEGKYCTTDDFAYVSEKLKYEFVKKGHYVIRQGEPGNKVFFILHGSANVIKWGEDAVYLDKKDMYNEISLIRS